jgi:hypothetical protein
MTYLLLKPMRKFVCLLLTRALLLCGGAAQADSIADVRARAEGGDRWQSS